MSIKRQHRYGYARVSSRDQNLARQISALTKAGIEKNHIFVDKQSGKDFDRPGYKRLIRSIREQDELYIKSIDRLGRNYDEILEQWRYLTKIKKADVIVLDFPLLDTRRSTGGVTGEFIADLVLQILSYVAQIERENTHQRQLEGIREAKKRGVRFGRPRLPIPAQFEEVAAQVRKNKISLRTGAKLLGVSHTTLRNWMKDQEQTIRKKMLKKVDHNEQGWSAALYGKNPMHFLEFYLNFLFFNFITKQ